MSAQSADDRSHDPTPKRLETAREQGDIARSPDLLAAAAYAGFLLATLTGAGALLQSAEAATTLLSLVDALATDVMQSARSTGAALTGAILLPLWPFFALPVLVVLALLIGQRVLVYNPEKLQPKLSRIDPIANAKQKFGLEGIAEFTKSVVKLGCTGLALWWLAVTEGGEILASVMLDPRAVMIEMLNWSLRFLVLIVILQALVGLLDLLWQKHRLIVRNRMSREDLREEMKDSDGDPQMRAHRRQMGQEIAMNRMLADLPKADVLIVNPTHYAVALKWDRTSRRPPVCVAKGTDEIALRLREAARQHGVPIRQDAPTARNLHATVQIGEIIRPEQYRAVAAAIRFAEAMRRKAREACV